MPNNNLWCASYILIIMSVWFSVYLSIGYARCADIYVIINYLLTLQYWIRFPYYSSRSNSISFCQHPHESNNTDGLVQESRNSIALAMELRLSCKNPSICDLWYRLLLSHAWTLVSICTCQLRLLTRRLKCMSCVAAIGDTRGWAPLDLRKVMLFVTAAEQLLTGNCPKRLRILSFMPMITRKIKKWLWGHRL